MLKKILVLSAIGVGVYLLITRKAHAEEVSKISTEIPATPQFPDNPAISMVDQILKEIEERVASAWVPTPVKAPALQPVTPAPVPMTPEEECMRQLPEWVVYSKGLAPITDPCGLLKRMKEQELL